MTLWNMIVFVNQFFLPMIKQKIENPKEEIEAELKKKKISSKELERHTLMRYLL